MSPRTFVTWLPVISTVCVAFMSERLLSCPIILYTQMITEFLISEYLVLQPRFISVDERWMQEGEYQLITNILKFQTVISSCLRGVKGIKGTD